MFFLYNLSFIHLNVITLYLCIGLYQISVFCLWTLWCLCFSPFRPLFYSVMFPDNWDYLIIRPKMVPCFCYWTMRVWYVDQTLFTWCSIFPLQVLDEIHRQPVSLSLSMVSLPAPESVVDSFPLKSHKKVDPADGGNDASLNSNYLEWICVHKWG